MPRTRPFQASELFSVAAFATPEQVEAINSALANGKAVTMEESSWNDPVDFCRVMIDGKTVLDIRGY